MMAVIAPYAAVAGGSLDDAVTVPDMGVLQPSCLGRPYATTFRPFEGGATVSVAARVPGRAPVKRDVHPGGELRVIAPTGIAAWTFVSDHKPQIVRATLRLRFEAPIGGLGPCNVRRLRLTQRARSHDP